MLNEIPTPALVIVGDAVERNIQRLADYCNEKQLGLRPHCKTHKSLDYAREQILHGAIGLTVAKTSEAEDFQSVSNSLLIAYPIVDTLRAVRIAELARTHQVIVAIDSQLAAECLSQAAVEKTSNIEILIDIDVGYHRTGVQAIDAAVDLAKFVDQQPGITMAGIFYYPGHIAGPSEQQLGQLQEVASIIDEAIKRWNECGLNVNIVSGGSTPTAFQAHHIPGTTEIRPGTYIFNDMNSVRFGVAEIDDCAARIMATVVSTSVPGQVVIDAGSKTLTSDLCGPAPNSGFGYIVEYPEAKVVKLTEEHGQVDVTGCVSPPKLGERMTIIPNHICPCVNLRNEVVLVKGNSVEFQSVHARGRIT